MNRMVGRVVVVAGVGAGVVAAIMSCRKGGSVFVLGVCVRAVLRPAA